MTLPASQVYLFDREPDLVDSALRLWNQAFEKSIRRGGRFCPALSGGKTPIPFYRELARQNRPDSWKRIHLFLVDERFGPPDHPDSNARMIAEVLARQAGLPAENVHPIPLNRQTAEESAMGYEDNLQNFFRLNRGEFPAFDFILLGIGEDGHTASLFPGNSALEETEKAVVAVKFETPRRDRVTLTLPVLNRGAKVVFLVGGEEKAEIVPKVLVERDFSLPAVRIKPHSGGPIFLLDRAAGKELPSYLRSTRGVE